MCADCGMLCECCYSRRVPVFAPDFVCVLLFCTQYHVYWFCSTIKFSRAELGLRIPVFHTEHRAGGGALSFPLAGQLLCTSHLYTSPLCPLCLVPPACMASASPPDSCLMNDGPCSRLFQPPTGYYSLSADTSQTQIKCISNLPPLTAYFS